MRPIPQLGSQFRPAQPPASPLRIELCMQGTHVKPIHRQPLPSFPHPISTSASAPDRLPSGCFTGSAVSAGAKPTIASWIKIDSFGNTE